MTRNTFAWLIPILMFSGLFYILRNFIDGRKLLPRRGEAEQMTLEIERPFGIRVLMWLSLLTGISGILGIFFPHPLFLFKYASPETRAQHAASIVFSISFLPLFWGIHRRLAVAWKFGWLILFASFSGFLAEVLESIRKQPDSGGWIMMSVATVMISCVAIYWGRWWYRQKKFFPQSGL